MEVPCIDYTDRSLAMRVRLPRLGPMALFLWEKVKVCWLAPPVLIMSPQAASVVSFHCTRESAIGSRPFV